LTEVLVLGATLFLRLLVLELAVVQDAADRRHGSRGDLNQIEFSLSRSGLRLG
jgi:hypothetical protein